MRQMKRLPLFLAAFCICLLIMGIHADPASAADSLQPQASDNLQISLKEKSELVPVSSGYMRVFYDGEKVGIEYYDDAFNITSKKSIAMELPIWGGFYAGENAYYLVEGQNNTAENDAAEVIRVIKYDKNWNRTGAAKITGNTNIFGGEVRYPFDYGCVEMAELNGTLYIVTGHEGYVDPDYNQGHQGFLMIAVDQASMTGKIVNSDLWHSFAQYIKAKGSYLYVLEQSEGSRYTKLSKYDPAYPENPDELPVFQYGGIAPDAWAIPCYASVDDLAVSANNVLCLGTSIDQSKYDDVSSGTAHNIYLTVTPLSNFTQEATTVKWLTSYGGNGASFLGAKLTKINDNRFLLAWEVAGTEGTAGGDDTLSGSTLHYIFLDGSGNKISSEYTASAPISDCHPVVKNEKIAYYASSSNMVNFYTIDASSGAFTKKCYRIAGSNATWTLKKGVLTISGTGEVRIDTEASYRRPVSSTAGSYVYSSDDNSWKSIRDQVKKIVIKSGLTSISDSAFAGFNNLTEVVIEPGLVHIGEKAFYSCDSLKKITIPSSVTEIGEDFLWTGSYWIGNGEHVVHATIYTPEGSYAAKYAKKYGISYTIDETADTTGTGLPAAPSSVSAKLFGYDDVKFSWKKVSGATGYYVYYKKASSKKWESLGTTKKNYIKKKNLADGTKYKFKVLSFKKADGQTLKSPKAKTKNIYTLKKLNKPAVKKSSASKIKISWNNINGESGYQIARSTKKSKGFKVVKTVKSTKAKSASLKVPDSKKYYYKVRAYKTVDGKKIAGPWSKVRSYKLK